MDCPENTMSAFRRAIELGAHGVELDVQSTSDGHLVVFHDASLDRTTNGTGLVFQTALDVIKELDAGSWHSPAFTTERVPLLSEVLALPNVEFEIELKGYGTAFLDAVLAAVVRADVFERVEFTGWNLLMLSLLKRKEPSARIGLFSSPPAPWMTPDVFEHHIVGTASTSGADIAHVHAGCLTPSIAKRLHEFGMKVHANDAANEDDVQRAFESGADRLSTNDVALAVGHLATLQ